MAMTLAAFKVLPFVTDGKINYHCYKLVTNGK